jgi:GTPase
MAVPQVAIVGRPNVGKSSLFNWLAGRRIAIVDPTAGVTRDRISTLVQAGGRYFELVDTGGMGINDRDNLTAEVEQQIALAIDRAAVILFLVDGRSGPMPLDEMVAERLRQADKPVLCVVNKCDAPQMETQTAEFYRYTREPLICVSAQEHRGKDQLLSRILDNLPVETSDVADVALKLAIVGRRNTGKSTFINSLAEEERVIVSEVAGTTRDSVDVRFERDGKTYIAIDTAGLRRKSSIRDDIEFYSLARAERSIRRADVVLMLMDPRWTISRVDKQLADYILDHHKPAIFVVNKWDLSNGLATGEFADYVHKVFPSLDYVPVAFITAKTGRNVQRVVNLAQNMYKQACARVSTGDLNRVLRQAMEANQPPQRMNRRPKVYYGTQVAGQPPTIVLFTNGPELLDQTYQRYLLKAFRDSLPFPDVPIKLYLRPRHGTGEESSGNAEAGRTPSPKPRKGRPVRGGKRDDGMWQNL